VKTSLHFIDSHSFSSHERYTAYQSIFIIDKTWIAGICGSISEDLKRSYLPYSWNSFQTIHTKVVGITFCSQTCSPPWYKYVITISTYKGRFWSLLIEVFVFVPAHKYIDCIRKAYTLSFHFHALSKLWETDFVFQDHHLLKYYKQFSNLRYPLYNKTKDNLSSCWWCSSTTW